ncbi:hypothetical protein A3Q56_02507 [Intoshia linei]|uniref:Ribonucleoside-diphosphate reductase n=1 Tax=Intoshia linei TaxID=1819745 RepID=A0A177B632_9BILA|nr:hypothetical protein A3Q56_02507 [Intoshia linei]
MIESLLCQQTLNPRKMSVVKRDGRLENLMLDKITSRIIKLCYGLDMEYIDPALVTMKVIKGIYPAISTFQLDNFAAEICADMVIHHPDYSILAGRIAISNLHKQTMKTFSEVIKRLYKFGSSTTGATGYINDFTYNVVMENATKLDSAIVYDRDYNYKYFGFKTLERSYLLKINGDVVERPQHLLMRCAVGIHGKDIDAAIETYNLLSHGYFTHASPTLYNAGTKQAQLSSCFLLTMKDDSIEGIYDTLRQCALISKSAGGIGVNIHCIRSKGSYIKGTNGTSNGIVPMLRVFDATARYVDQGGNKRPGAIAIYLEPWHADIFDFLTLRTNIGSNETKTRDLFYALWIPDLFMRRVEKDENWTLICPNEFRGLDDVWGEKFDRLYESAEKQNIGKTIKARVLWHAIINSQIETGVPYMLYKDACNSKSNQQNVGTIKCSNLCTEIIEYSNADETAVCNLASIALPKFVSKDKEFDFKKLERITQVIVKNLNKIIDINYYPVPEAKRSNLRHRPIGIGVQGLADCFVLMRFPFTSKKAMDLNKKIFETIYYAAVYQSMLLAKDSEPYETFQGSPISKGLFQFDLWEKKPIEGLYDWDDLRRLVMKYGVRNSLLLSPMPTASTAQILGNNESIEAFTSNLYVRRVLSGEFQVVNSHLLRDLTQLGLWNKTMRNKLISGYGSIQHIDEISQELKDLYKTVWEIPQKLIIDMAADRAIYIDQSQSMNIHIQSPNYAKLTSLHFYTWKKGLKTGMYYLRTKPATNAQQFTVQNNKKNTLENNVENTSIKSDVDESLSNSFEKAKIMCSIENKNDCHMCGS